MSIAFQCERCGRDFHVSEQQAGKRARCKSCGHVLRVPGGAVPGACAPAASTSGVSPVDRHGEPAAARAAADRVSFQCPECGHEYRVTARMFGKRVACRECGAAVRVPAGAVSPAEAESPLDDVYGLADARVSSSRVPAASDDRPAHDEVAAADRGWMTRAAKHPRNEPGGDAGPALKMGLGLAGFGIIALFLPHFGLGLRMRGGKVLDENETVGAGLFMIVIGAIVAAFGFIKSRMPERATPRKGRSRAFVTIVGGVVGFILGLMILRALSKAIGWG